MRPRTKEAWAWVASGALFSLALALLISPIFLPVHSVPKAPLPTVSTEYPAASLASIAARFDLSKLPPEERPKPPPPDLAASLRSFKLIGVIEADDSAIAVMTDGGPAMPVRVGETLAGFSLSAAAGRHASFVNGETHVEFSLAEGMRSWSDQSAPSADRPPIKDIQ